MGIALLASPDQRIGVAGRGAGPHPPLVSIVIPCWNAEAFVGEAIESALAQTYPQVEVIVVDDGSTDASLDVIRAFGERVRCETGPNRGACAARNRGVALARGELIQFLDADDLLLPDKLSRMVPVALAGGRGAMAICDWVAEPSPGAAQRVSLAYGGEDPLVFCLGNQLPTPSPLHWRANLEQVGSFDESLPCSQERDLHLRLACSGLVFSYVPEPLFRVRRRADSLSADGLKIIKQHKMVFDKALQLARAKGALSEERREAFARAFAKDARHLVRFHDCPALAMEYYALAESISRGVTFRAFGNSAARLLARAIGPISTERLIAGLLGTELAPQRR